METGIESREYEEKKIIIEKERKIKEKREREGGSEACKG
jgi:hypothetical protein